MKTYHKKSCQKLIDFILIIHQIIIKKNILNNNIV